MRLIEPLGLLNGRAAREAVARGLAVKLAGGPAAFSLVRLTDGAPGGAPDAIVPIGAVPEAFQSALCAASLARPCWAGLVSAPPHVMGILNVTPDSFSDGGRHDDPGKAIAAGLAMREAGADIVDVGGESTRPGSAPLDPAEEQARVLPVVRALAAAGVPVSVDTRHAATMRAALDAGARIINDVSALAHDPDAARVVARAGAAVVLMHMRGTPQTMHEHAEYRDVAAEVACELADRIAAATAAGIAPAHIAIDPGIGFAKGHDDNIRLLDRLGVLHSLGFPLLVGVSRKRVIGTLTGEADPAHRDPGSLAAALRAAEAGAAVLRVHDVAGTAQALRVWRGLTEAKD